MPAAARKLEHELAIYLHRLTLHCIYRKVFTTKNVKASYAIGRNANKRETFSRKCKGHTSNLASLQHSSHNEQSVYEQFMKISPYTFFGLFFFCLSSCSLYTAFLSLSIPIRTDSAQHLGGGTEFNTRRSPFLAEQTCLFDQKYAMGMFGAC